MANVVRDLTGFGRVFEVLPSAARTATPDSFEFSGHGRNVSGLLAVLDVTAAAASSALTLSILGVDPISGKTWELLKNVTPIGTVGATPTRFFRVRWGLTAINADPSFAANDVLPPVFRIACTHGNANSLTYSVSGHFVY